MKKKYRKPNIYEIDLDIFDIICTSEYGDKISDDDEIIFGSFRGRGTKSNGGFDGIGWY